MSMLRKTVLTTAIVGAGLSSMTGAAFAWDSHGDGGSGHTSSHSTKCSNDLLASQEGSNDALGDIANGDQAVAGANGCDIANDNDVASHNTAVAPDASFLELLTGLI